MHPPDRKTDSNPKDKMTMPKPNIEELPPPSALEELNRAHAENVVLQNCNAALEKQITAQKLHLQKLEENTFSYALNNLDAGSVLEDLGSSLEALTKLVVQRQDKGSLILTLAVKPFKADSLLFTADVKTKEPPTESPASLFFPSADGHLSRQDPRQQSLPFSSQ